MESELTNSGWRKKQISRHIHPEPIAEAYDEEWDAFYNVERNEWLESKCDDPTCEYCTRRPDRPLDND